MIVPGLRLTLALVAFLLFFGLALVSRPSDKGSAPLRGTTQA